MRTELLSIAEQFSEYDVQFSNTGESFDIINPFGKDSIRVCMENDVHEPYMVCFSFQHRHLATADEVIAYVSDIIGGNVFAIEFFKDGRKRFGGDLDAQEVRELSYDMLARFLGCFGASELIDVADSFKVRGWAQDGDFDAKFITGEMGKVILVKELNLFDSRKIRDLFVNRFVDQTTERYKKIKEIDLRNDAVYLWDTLLKPFSTKVNYYSAINYLQNSSNKVFLMMDIQRRNRGSEETQFNLYLKKHNYNRESVFELPASEVAELYRIDNEIHTSWLPSDLNLLEDIYVFDESFKWLIVFTHEYVDQTDTNAHRICFSNLSI